MERGSSKHGPRIDEELEQEVAPLEQGSPSESRAEEGRQQESPDDQEHVPDTRMAEGPWPLEELASDPEEARRELGRALPPSVFPADRGRLIDAAASEHAPAPVVQALEGLPEGRLFEDLEEVWGAVRR